MLNNLVEVVARQSEALAIEAGIIDDLFGVLCQHLSAEELENLQALGRIREADKLLRGIESDD